MHKWRHSHVYLFLASDRQWPIKSTNVCVSNLFHYGLHIYIVVVAVNVLSIVQAERLVQNINNVTCIYFVSIARNSPSCPLKAYTDGWILFGQQVTLL